MKTSLIYVEKSEVIFQCNAASPIATQSDESNRRHRLCNCIVPDPSVVDENLAVYPTVFEEKPQSECDIPCGPEFSTYNSNWASNDDGEVEFKLRLKSEEKIRIFEKTLLNLMKVLCCS